MRQRRKESLILLIIILVLSLGIGYAFLTTTLNIDGTADVDSNSWNVYWDSVRVLDGSVTGDKVITPATINATKDRITFRVNLKEPSDNYTISATAANGGTIPARIEEVNYYINGEKYENVFIPYLTVLVFDEATLSDIEVGDLLLPEMEKNYTFVVQYSNNINPSDLPSTNQTVTFSLEIIYSQAPGSVSKLYSGYNNIYNDRSGNNVIPPFTTYNTYQEAMNTMAEGTNMFMKYYIYNDSVYEYSIGFIINSNIYYLIGGDTGWAFEKNKNTLLSAFGSDYCHQNQLGSIKIFICNDSVSNVKLYEHGGIDMVSGLYLCRIRGSTASADLLYGCTNNSS